jgi:hypothetical protein
MRMAVAFYVTGISTPDLHLESPPLLGTLTNCAGSPTIFWQHALGSNYPVGCHLWFCNDTSYGVDLDALNPSRPNDINRMIHVPL